MYYSVRGIYLQKTLVKGSLTRDFRLQVFFHESFSAGDPEYPGGTNTNFLRKFINTSGLSPDYVQSPATFPVANRAS